MNRKTKSGMLASSILLSLFCFLFFIHATRVEDPQRTMRYTSRSVKDAAIWQSEVRRNLFRLLKLDDLLLTCDSIALNSKEILSEDSFIKSGPDEGTSALMQRIDII